MKITGLRTRPLNVPFPEPITTSIHRIDGAAVLAVWLETDAGVTGESYLWTIGAHRLPVLDAMVHSLFGTVRGHDPRDTEALGTRIWREINFLGHKGVTIFAMSALDWACWDIRGRAADMSVSRLLGRARDRVPAYASGGLWASRDIPALEREAGDLVARGFRAVKMRIGLPDIGEDLERVAAVRNAIGPGIELMADANQGLGVHHAIRLGRGLDRFDLAWFEEPVQAYDLAGSARVAAEIDTPVASGETEYTRYGFQDMIDRGSADILMPDLERVGGVSEWLKVAHMAAARDIPVSPHLFTEHCLQLCGAVANVSWAEHMPWFEPLFREQVEFVDGNLVVPDRPGMGFSFDPDAIDRFALAPERRA